MRLASKDGPHAQPFMDVIRETVRTLAGHDFIVAAPVKLNPVCTPAHVCLSDNADLSAAFVLVSILPERHFFNSFVTEWSVLCE